MEHGEPTVARVIERAIEADRIDLLGLTAPKRRPRNAVPAVLAAYDVEAGRATDYNALLGGVE